MLYPRACSIVYPSTVRPSQREDVGHGARQDRSQPAPPCVRCLLQLYYSVQLTGAEQAVLAEAIAPYLERTRLPWPDTVYKISMNYLRDGARVQRLIQQPDIGRMGRGAPPGHQLCCAPVTVSK